ncbi:hypothetical protein [Leptospira ryugenii]|uniref:hypothetical protein n=1 Tax=Leptospira ryugenii TaxID=1917863 RepID=UPI00107F5B3C|nr:hypothetical protein [Leptospira ryugenii]
MAVFAILGSIGPLHSEPYCPFPPSFWLNAGFTMKESVEIFQACKQEKKEFFLWLQKKPKEKKILSLIYREKSKAKAKHTETKKEKPTKKTEELNIQSFLAGSYQVTDSRYFPLYERNHSSFQMGGKVYQYRWILEKRDNRVLGGFSFEGNLFHAYLGSRYKPMPNFYFAKDPNFFSQFDGNQSHLPQPLLDSHFLGFNTKFKQEKLSLGIYKSYTVSPDPGFYFVNQEKSFAFTSSLTTGIISLYLQKRFVWEMFPGVKHHIQGEGIGSAKSWIGFVFHRSEINNLNLKFDITGYRNQPGINIPISELSEKQGSKQDLGFQRIRYKEYYQCETLFSREGLRYESGFGILYPVWISAYGAISFRYRYYEEKGFYNEHSFGRGIFYEYRENNSILSLGIESRVNKLQYEAKIAYPVFPNYRFELSILLRDKDIMMRSWFENWSFATDFNMDLVDRPQIWKLKFVGQNLSLNVSISEKKGDPNYIYYTNFQFQFLF